MIAPSYVRRSLRVFVCIEATRKIHQNRECHVSEDCMVDNESESLPILGDEAEPMPDGIRGPRYARQFPLDQDLARSRPRMRTEDSHEKVATARSHQTGDAEDFAAPHRETHAPHEHLAAHVGVFDGDVTRFEDGLSSLVVGLREDVADLAPDHAGDDV